MITVTQSSNYIFDWCMLLDDEYEYIKKLNDEELECLINKCEHEPIGFFELIGQYEWRGL